jgi:hypothetical protein
MLYDSTFALISNDIKNTDNRRSISKIAMLPLRNKRTFPTLSSLSISLDVGTRLRWKLLKWLFSEFCEFSTVIPQFDKVDNWICRFQCGGINVSYKRLNSNFYSTFFSWITLVIHPLLHQTHLSKTIHVSQWQTMTNLLCHNITSWRAYLSPVDTSYQLSRQKVVSPKKRNFPSPFTWWFFGG